jgi:GTPase SAR1 family protein
MWADNETTEDYLGFQVHVDLIRSVVTDPKLLPATIGLFGDWGSGKTSIMKMLERDLSQVTEEEDSPKIICVYFNGWLFEGYDDAKAAIISSILLELANHKKIGPLIRDKAVSLLKSVNWMRIARFGVKNVAIPAVLAYATGGASLVPSLATTFKDLFGKKEQEESSEQNNGESQESETTSSDTLEIEDLLKSESKSSSPMDVRTFRERFSEMLKDSKINSLVVLIDDLDRCSPDRILDNLEAIKLFLNVEQTAFIIGADRRIVRHAISKIYKTRQIAEEGKDPKEDSEDTLVTDYLEKLIQIPYHIPRLSPAEVESYMVLLFCRRDLEDDNFKRCIDEFHQFRLESRYSTFGYSNVKTTLGEENFSEKLAISLRFCSAASPLITEGLKGNPRQVKRFLNAFILRKKLADVAKLNHIRDDILIKLMILEYSHPKRFEELFKWQTAENGFPKIIRDLEETFLTMSREEQVEEKDSKEKIDIPPEWDTASLKKWIEMEPYLSKIDLRDYFWIARDRLQSTFSDVSLMSPFVRSLLEDLLSGNAGRLQNAINAAKVLEESDNELLLDRIEKQIIISPNEHDNYNVLFNMIEANIPNSARALIRALDETSSSKITPTIGPRLLSLVDSRPEHKSVFEPIIEKLKQTNTPIARALKPRERARTNK